MGQESANCCRTPGQVAERLRHTTDWQSRATPCTLSPTPRPTPALGELLPFASGVSGFSLEPAPVRLAPEDTGGLFLPAQGDVNAREVGPPLREAGSSVLAGGAWGDGTSDSLAAGLACGPSVLPWDFRAGEGLWVRAEASGTGGPRSPSRRDPQAEAPQPPLAADS